MKEKNYIEVKNYDMKNIEGKLLTLIESSVLSDRQCEGMKGTARTLLWEWHDGIYNRVTPVADVHQYDDIWGNKTLEEALQDQQSSAMTGYSYKELKEIVSEENNEENLEKEEVEEVDKSVNLLLHIFNYYK